MTDFEVVRAFIHGAVKYPEAKAEAFAALDRLEQGPPQGEAQGRQYQALLATNARLMKCEAENTRLRAGLERLLISYVCGCNRAFCPRCAALRSILRKIALSTKEGA